MDEKFTPLERASRWDVVRVARSYLGTRYLHQGRVPGVGLDCLGIVICVCRELGLVAPDFDVKGYTEQPDGHKFMQWCDRYMTRVRKEDKRPGDCILLISHELPQHMGILGCWVHGGLSIIHSANNARPPRVLETRLVLGMGQQFVGAYALPGVSDV